MTQEDSVLARIEILLLVASVDLLRQGGTRFLFYAQGSDGWALPWRCLGHATCWEVASDLLFYLTGIQARKKGVGWVDLTQAPLVDSPQRSRCEQRWLAVPYTCLLPGDLIPLKDARASWLTLGQLLCLQEEGQVFADHFDILTQACQQLQ